MLRPALATALIASAPQTAFQPRPSLDAGRYLQTLSEAEAELKRNPGTALAWAAKSQSLSALLRFAEADEAAAKALALKPDLADAYLARGTARGGLAIQQRNFGSLRKASAALDDFKKAADLDPAYVAAWTSLGLAYQQLPGILGGSTREALRCADRLSAVSPSRGALLKGMVLALDKRWSEADPWLSRALQAAPADPQVVYGYFDALTLSATRESLGRDAWKARLARDARKAWPPVQGSVRGLQAVTDALLEAGEAEEAWRLAAAALGPGEAPSLVRLQLGKIAARGGVHREEGLAHLAQVLREPLEGGSGGYPAVHYRMAQILKDLGRTSEARRSAQACLALDPRHSGARRLLSELPA